ncbi:MAG: hypothetical protein JXB10_16900 [Pirellulales bacterium]|nr:hypothetical protein [Pirellulales bacterium]
MSDYLSQGLSPTIPRPAEAVPAQTPAARNIALKNVSAWQLNQALRNIIGSRLSAIPGSSREANRFYLAMADQGGAELFFDYGANRITVQGSPQAQRSAALLIEALDDGPKRSGEETRLVALQTARADAVRKMASAVSSEETARAVQLPVAMRVLGEGGTSAPEASRTRREGDSPIVSAQKMGQSPVLLAQAGPGGNPPSNGPPAEETKERAGGLIGSVQVQMIEGLGVVVIRGNRRDVEQVMKIIEQIEKLSAETEPEIVVHPLRFVNSESLADLVKSLYTEVFLDRQGSVSITALVKPNALLLIGRKENVERVLELVGKLDQPASPDAQFRVFRLRQAAAANVETILNELYQQSTTMRQAPGQQAETETTGLAVRARITADARTNAVIVLAAPRDLNEIAALIERLDSATSEAVNELRVIQLQHSLASDLAEVIRSAIGASSATGRGTTTAPGALFRPGQPGGTSASGTAQQRSAILQFFARDGKRQRLLQSGILSDVQITADARSNAILLAAPAESIDLLEALIKELDQLPGAEAQIKVFQIVNGDASDMANTLQLLFSAQGGANNARGGGVGMTPFGPVLMSGGGEESTLVPLRFAVDIRTNCIIATGTADALRIVETLLYRLDLSDVQNRKTEVYRLKNAPAQAVAEAIQNFLQSEQTVEQLAIGGEALPFEQISRQVVVVPENNTNSLIVSTTPNYFQEIIRLVKELDHQPPMVMIQVLIAEVTLNDTDELGVEMGLQDSILFDRSVANVPGFLFNNQQLGNNTGAANPDWTGAQGLSSFSMGRTSSNAGYGGFVFSASSESVSVLVRALKDCNRLNVLSRPQIMTLDNQPAYVQVGQYVPTVTGLQTNATGGTLSGTEYAQTGIIMQVWPRVSPENTVLMQVYASKSDTSPTGGIPIGISDGQPVIAPRFDVQMANTTVTVGTGQTVALGGLITKSREEFHRKVPGLGDVPVLGRLFRFDGVREEKTELLIILTPHVVRRPEDAESIKRVEAARMNWCLSDVTGLMPDDALRLRSGEWSDQETSVFYPDGDPNAPQKPFVPESGEQGQREPIPVPPGAPQAIPQNGSSGWHQTPSSPSAPGPPDLPREPAALPDSGQVRSQLPPASPAVVRVPAAEPAPTSASGGVIPTLYDAPPRYPTTQTPFYR